AYLMAADARAAVRRLPEVRDVTVVLEDHYTGAEINAAVGRGAGFDAAFPGEAAGSLEALRELFRRKALVAGHGAPVAAGDLSTWLRRARLVSLSLEANGGMCRALLRVRYGVSNEE